MFRRNTGPTPQQWQQVWDRAQNMCERCGRDMGDGGPRSIHHRKPRKMGGSKDPEINSLSNLMLLCGTGTTGCHGWVEDRRLEAQADGYLVPSWENPADVRVLVHKHFVMLLADGTYGDA